MGIFHFDLPRNSQWNFQDPATPIAEGIINLHHTIFFFLLLIIGFVVSILFSILKDNYKVWPNPTEEAFNAYRLTSSPEEYKEYFRRINITHGTILEIVWTILPAIILFLIAAPSFSLLYAMEAPINPKMTVLITGNQWYWHYEYYENIEGDPVVYLGKTGGDSNYNNKGYPRLLDVDNELILPCDTPIRFLVTSADVIHSFAVPSLGIKIDAVPGRLNEVTTYLKREGLFYGQCSELCGAAHAFMPIKIYSTFVDNVAFEDSITSISISNELDIETKNLVNKIL